MCCQQVQKWPGDFDVAGDGKSYIVGLLDFVFAIGIGRVRLVGNLRGTLGLWSVHGRHIRFPFPTLLDIVQEALERLVLDAPSLKLRN